MEFLKKIDWTLAGTMLVVVVVGLWVYDMYFSDSVAEKKAAKEMKKA